MKSGVTAGNWIARLRHFAHPPRVGEVCDLCGTAIGDDHLHAVDPAAHRLFCCCEACVAQIDAAEASPFRLVPTTAQRLDGFAVTEASWQALRLPIDLAFFYFSSPEQRIIAFYPSPAGATQSTLSLAAWNELVGDEPGLHRMRPDVEALLVNRLGTARDAYLLPIDKCYALTGEIRTRWRGLSAGLDAKDFVAAFLRQLVDAPAVAAPRVHHHTEGQHGRA